MSTSLRQFSSPTDLLETLGNCKPNAKTYAGTSTNFKYISAEREKKKQRFNGIFSSGKSLKGKKKEKENSKLEDGISECKETMTKILSLLGMEKKQELKQCYEGMRKKYASLDDHQDIEDAMKRIQQNKLFLDKPSYVSVHQDVYSHMSKKKAQKSICQTDHIPRELLGDLLRIREIPNITSTVLILTEELQRLATFNKFPRDVDISCLRLAQAGFYYEGREKETTCYSCGVTYSNWTSGDNPIEVHKRISPNCVIVTKNENISKAENHVPTDSRRNLTISNDTHASGISSNGNSSCTGTTTISTQCSDDIPENKRQSNISCPGNTNHQPETNTSNSDIAQSARSHDRETNYTERITNSELSTQSISNETELYPDYSSLGIYTEKPRYPNYSPLQVRISSYQGWPSYLDQTPKEMAMAGFLFAGYNDYTRCFFCGGGLRNWEAGDDPWIEHARWFPECAFLKQNKGEAFISAVMRKQKELEARKMEQEEISQHQEHTGASNYSIEHNDNRNIVNQKDQLNSAASRAVLEMGYSNEQVIGAIQNIKQSRSGETIIEANDIINVLLSNNESSSGASDVQKDDKQHPDPNYTDLTDLQIDDTELLLEENRQLRDQRLCKVCLDSDASIAFLPCGHIVCCAECAPAMRKCPICRTYVKGTVKTYLA